jgi:erythromycin esterase
LKKKQLSHRLEQSIDLDPLIEEAGINNIRYVLLGEASHGTSEFYSWRSEITKRLIAEKKFSFIAVEGGWPDCYNLNRYVKGMSNHMANNTNSAYDILYTFNRWPTWMWANREIIDLIEWLKNIMKSFLRNKK